MIDPNLVDLLNPKGFNALFEQNLRDLKGTHVQAYEETEKEFQKHFGRRKYSGHDSFRHVRNRKIRKR